MLSLRSLIGLALIQALASATPTPQAATSNGTTVSTENFQAAALCGNGGLEWAAWPSNVRNDNRKFTTFRPARAFKKTPPDVSGRIPFAGGISVVDEEDEINVYNSGYVHTASFLAIAHRGYIYGAEAGTYTVTFSQIDDGLFFWAGPRAYQGWKRGNQVITVIVPVSNTGSYKVEVGANEYVPIRFIFGAGQGATGFSVKITSPSGVVVLSDKTKASEHIVAYSCDLTTAPRFDLWGEES